MDKGQGRERRDRLAKRQNDKRIESWVEVGVGAQHPLLGTVLSSLHTPRAQSPSSKAPSLLPPTRASQPWSRGTRTTGGIPDSFQGSSLPPGYIRKPPSSGKDVSARTRVHAHAHTHMHPRTCTATREEKGQWRGERGVSLCPPAQPWELKATQRPSHRASAPRAGDKWGERGKGRPQSCICPLVGLGSKMGAVLTATEATEELSGRGR